MNMLSNYINSFCEIKIADSSKVVCTGYIFTVTENRIAFQNMVVSSGEKNFRGIITVLGQGRGLQVFQADVSIMADNTVSYINMSKITNVERRAAFRAIVDLPALVTTSGEPLVSHDAIIKDMSVRGIGLWLHKSFNVDDIIHIQFPLDINSGIIHSCDCNIVRNIGSTGHSLRKYGCEFMNLSSESVSAIKTLLNKKRTEMMQRELFE